MTKVFTPLRFILKNERHSVGGGKFGPPER